MTTERSTPTIDPQLLDLLRCPLTGSRLRPEGDFLVAQVGGLAYPVRDGFPVMLIPYASAETLAQMAEGVAGYRAAFVGAGGLPEAATVPFGPATSQRT